MCQFRTLSIVAALAAGLLAAATPAPGQAQRVGPDPAAVQTLQAIQTAYDRKDTAQYARLLAGQIPVTLIGDKQERVNLFPDSSRDKFISQFLKIGEDAGYLSPFIDATPVSQRVLYAVNVPNGQSLRVLMLNRPLPKAQESVSWVMDLHVTRQGGQYVLTEMVACPEDLTTQVLIPMFKQASADDVKDEAGMTHLYNQYWVRFAATLPKPAAMPVGPQGTPRPPVVVTKTPSTPPKPPVNVPPPPPPARIDFPVTPTSYVPLPNPPPVFLPPQQVTPRVRQWRSQAQAMVQQRFAAFLDRMILEQYLPFQGQRFYISVYQVQYRATYTKITLIISIRLIFVQPPRGPMQPYVVPIIEPETPTPPIQAQPPAQTPIALQPPAQRAVGCMVLTDTEKLKAKHGQARYEQIRQYLASFGEMIDLAGKNARDYRAVDAIVEQNFNRNGRDCLFIFGNHDIVPLAALPNPTMAQDKDAELYSDDPYADFDHDPYIDPEIMIVRMPDDPNILGDSKSVLYRPAATSPRITLTDYASLANRHRPGAALLDQVANPNRRDLFQRSGPMTSQSFPGAFFPGRNVLITLHGSDAWDASDNYQGESQEGNQDPMQTVTAMTADQAVAPDGVVFSIACYGASTWVTQSGRIVPKTSDNHVGLRFLRNGASAFIGYTRISWSPGSTDPAAVWQSAEPLAPRRFIELTRQGHSPQKAFQLLKREMAPANYKEPSNKKMQHQLIYLGLPPVGNRTVNPVATPSQPATLRTQLVRVLEQASDAAQQQKSEALVQLMTPTVREGIQEGPEVPAQTMAQQILQLTGKPEAVNPLADKDTLGARVFLVEKAGDKEFTVHLRVPVKSPRDDQPQDTVQRLRFRLEGDQIKLSGWEDKNPQFVEKVDKPYAQWIREQPDPSPEEAREKHEELVEDFVASTVSSAAQAKTDATTAVNPLAPQGGQTPAWLIPVLVGAGLAVVLAMIVAAASRKRATPQQRAPIAFKCPHCGVQHNVGPEFAGRSAKCACGNVVQVPGGPGGADGLQFLPDQSPQPQAVAPVRVVQMPAAPPQFIMLVPGGVSQGEVRARGESGGRRMAIIFFGLLLLAGFFIPVITPTSSDGITAEFPTLRQLSEPTTPAMAKFLLAFPAIAAVLAIILACVSDMRWRGGILTLLPWAPIIIVALQKDGSASLLTHELFGSWDRTNWPLLVGLLGLPALWVASRARWYRPAYGFLYWLGLAGAVAFALSQGVPLGPSGSRSVFSSGLISTVRDGTDTTAQGLAILALAGLGLLALASLLSLCNPPGRRESIRGLAGGTFSLLVLAVLALVLYSQVPSFIDAGRVGGTAAFAAILGMIKSLLLSAGMMLLFLGGLVNVIIGPTPKAIAN